ncbi:MAG: acyltransferase [Clostridiales bacterium]|nr:acyltransferase [Candidatus Equinaster intestinalis]
MEITAKPARNIRYDLIRCLAMAMVLAQHTLASYEVRSSGSFKVKFCYYSIAFVLMLCNPIFFLISGKFNLKKNFTKPEDYKIFYIKKAVSIVLPFVLLSVATYLLNFYNKLSIKDFINRFFNNEIQSVYWFMYILIGIVALSPFYSKMLLALSKKEKTILFAILLVIRIFVTVLAAVYDNPSFTSSTFGIVYWHLFYLVGFIAEDVFDTRKKQNIVILLGILGYIFQLFIAYFYMGDFPWNMYNPHPWTLFESLALYFIVLRINVKTQFFTKIIEFTAKQSFIFYLVHIDVLYRVYDPIVNALPINKAFSAIIVYVVSFLLTLLISYIINTLIIIPLQKLALLPLKKKAK